MSAADVNLLRMSLGILGSRPDTPAMLALQRLERKVALYEWVLPVVTGEDDAQANERTMRIAAELLRGLKGEAALIAASQS